MRHIKLKIKKLALHLTCGCALVYIQAGAQEKEASFALEETQNTYTTDSAEVARLTALGDRLLVSDLDSAFVLLKDAYRIAGRHQMTHRQIHIMALIATGHLQRGELARSNYLLQKAITQASGLPDKELLVFLHNIAGLVYRESGAPSAAMIHFLKAREILQLYQLEKSKYALQTYNNLGSVWMDLNERNQALRVLEAAERILPRPDTAGLRAYILINKGLVYWDTDTAEALKQFLEALDIVREKGNHYIMHTALINISTLYMKSGNDTAAFRYLHEAEEAAARIGSLQTDAITAYQYGILYLSTADYEKAGRQLRRSLRLTDSTGNRLMKADLEKAFSELYAKSGRYELAYSMLHRYTNYLDSMQSHRKDKTVDVLLQYQEAERSRMAAEQQLQLMLERDRVRKRNILITVLTISFASLFLILFQAGRNRRRLAAQRDRIERMQAQAEGAERERVRIGYDLHDGVMAGFAAVKMMLHTLPDVVPGAGSSPDYQKILTHFARATRELRQTAHNLMPDTLLEEGLGQAVFYYCRSLGDTSGLNITFQQYGDLPRLHPDLETSMYRIIQELLQNVVKHAHAGNVIVQLDYRNAHLYVTVEDDGSGFPADGARGGMGLAGIRNRLTVFNGIFDIQSSDSGTTAYIECPADSRTA